LIDATPHDGKHPLKQLQSPVHYLSIQLLNYFSAVSVTGRHLNEDQTKTSTLREVVSECLLNITQIQM